LSLFYTAVCGITKPDGRRQNPKRIITQNSSLS